MSAPKEFSQIVLDLHRAGLRLQPTLNAFLEFYSLKPSGFDAGAKNLSQIVVEFYKIPELRQVLKNMLHFYASELNQPLDDGGNTLLHYAYCYRDGDMIQFLLDNGAILGIKNYAGKMPTERL